MSLHCVPELSENAIQVHSALLQATLNYLETYCTYGIVHLWTNCDNVPTYIMHLKRNAPMGALVVYALSPLTHAIKVYTVECTYGVHWTCNVQQCMHTQRKLHVHCKPYNAHALCMCSVHSRRTVQCTLQVDCAVYTPGGLCSVHSRWTVNKCAVWRCIGDVNSVPVIALTPYNAPALCPCEFT